MPTTQVSLGGTRAGVFYAILAIVVLSVFVSFGMVLYGMRGAAAER